MKLAPHTLRWRLQIWYGVLLVVVLCAFGFTAHHLETVERLRNVDNELQHRLAAVVNELRAGPQRPDQRPPRTQAPGRPNLNFSPEVAALFGDATQYYFIVWMQEDQPVARSANAPQDALRPERTDPATRSRSGQLRETFIFAAPVDCVLVGRFIADEKRAIVLNAALLATAGGVLFLLGLIGGGWLIARAIRPIGNITATAARIAEGDLTQRIRGTDDQSELGRLSIALNQTFSRLEGAFAQQQRFTADAAHELRTPLTVLLTQVQTTLARTRNAEEYRETLESCQRSAQRMRKLLESLLELARLDAGDEPVHFKPFDFARIARECLEIIKPVALEQGVTLREEIQPATVQGDADRLAQVITNLLINAIQHTPCGGVVTLRLRGEGSSAVMEVSDTGSGIAPDDLPHLFVRFYRADKARSGAAGRSGLGLSIAKAIMDAHRGSITVESTPGSGSRFIVRLG